MIALMLLMWAFYTYRNNDDSARAVVVERLSAAVLGLVLIFMCIIWPFRATYHADAVGSSAVVEVCVAACAQDNLCLGQNIGCIGSIAEAAAASDMTQSLDIALWILAIL